MKHGLWFFLTVALAFTLAANAQDHPAEPTGVNKLLLKSQLVKQRVAKPFSATSTSLPQMISYQGLLTTTSGTPVADGSYNLTVSFYDSLANGNLQWSEIHSGVTVQRGTFSLALGSITPLTLQFNKPLFVQVTATSGPSGPSYPLTFSPRSQLLSAPYSLAPWVTNGTDIYYKNGNIGIGSSAPESSGIGFLKMDIADENGNNSDIAQRVAGGSFGVYHFASSGGTLESPTIVSNGAYLGILTFDGYNGTTYSSAATVESFVDSIPSAEEIPGRLSFYTSSQSMFNSEKMRLDRNGNLAIDFAGLNNGSINPGLTFGNGYSGEGIASKRTTGGNQFGLDFYTSYTNRMSIANNGYVGIGTTPNYQLDVLGDYNGYVAHIINQNTGSAFGLAVEANNSTSAGPDRVGILSDAWNGASSNYGGELSGYGGIYAYGVYATAYGGTNNYGVYGIASGGTNSYAGYFSGNLAYTGSLINASDAKFKENIVDYSGALSKIMQVKPRTFTFKTTPEYTRLSFSPGEHYGFVAQELEQVFPELVVTATQPPETDAKGMPKGDPMEYKGVKTMEMIPILVQAIQEQQKLIQELQAKVAQLEQK